MIHPVQRVLQVHNVQTAFGGADVVVENERQLLEANGVEVRQFLPTTVELTPSSTLRTAQLMVRNGRARGELQALIDDFAPDVVHFHTVFPMLSPEVLRVDVSAQCARVVTLHSYRHSCIAATHVRAGAVCTDCSGKRIKLPGMLHRCYHGSFGASAAATAALAVHGRLRTFRDHVDAFFALTPFQRNNLAGEGIDPDRILVKPNFLVEAFAEPLPATHRAGVLFVGRLTHEKGIASVVDAWKRGMEPTLTVAGDGPLRPLVEELAATTPTVTYVGPVSRDEVRQLLSTAQLLVFPSLWYEGMPMVLLEALALGCPVAVSDFDNLRSIVAPTSTLPIQVGSVDSLRSVVSGAIADAGRLDQMARAAFEEFQSRYSIAEAWPNLRGAYDEAREIRLNASR